VTLIFRVVVSSVLAAVAGVDDVVAGVDEDVDELLLNKFERKEMAKFSMALVISEDTSSSLLL